MAGDYIVVRTDLHEDPAVFWIARKCGLSPDAVVGKLVRVWRWATAHSATGNLPGIARSEIDGIAGHPGFSEAMETTPLTAWLIVNEAGATFPHWEHWMSNGAKYRLGEQLRNRERRRSQSNDREVTGKTTGQIPVERPANDRDNLRTETETETEIQRCTLRNSASASREAPRGGGGNGEPGYAGAASAAHDAEALALEMHPRDLEKCIAYIRRRIPRNADELIRAGPIEVLRHIGCDESFTSALRQYVAKNGIGHVGLARAFWQSVLELAERNTRPHRPGGWWREALARHGIDLRRAKAGRHG